MTTYESYDVDLVVIVPSRGRPDNIVEFRDAWNAATEGTAGCSAVTSIFVVVVDDDDPAFDDYLAIPEIYTLHGPRVRLGPTLNRAAQHFAIRSYAVGFMGDDHRTITRGWDTAWLTELRRLGTGLVYGNDLIQGPNLPTAVGMTSDIVRALGYMVPPNLIHMYLDNFWKDLGNAVGRLTYLPDVVIEHKHPIAGKAEWDEQYKEANALMIRDRMAYDLYKDRYFARDLAKVREIMQ